MNKLFFHIILNFCILLCFIKVAYPLSIKLKSDSKDKNLKPISKLFISENSKKVEFESENQFKDVYVKLLSDINGKIKLICNSKNIQMPDYIELEENKAKMLNVRVLSCRENIKIYFIDNISENQLGYLQIECRSNKKIYQISTIEGSSSYNLRFYHNIYYNNWSGGLSIYNNYSREIQKDPYISLNLSYRW